jgi:hypothetical protein
LSAVGLSVCQSCCFLLYWLACLFSKFFMKRVEVGSFAFNAVLFRKARVCCLSSENYYNFWISAFDCDCSVVMQPLWDPEIISLINMQIHN